MKYKLILSIKLEGHPSSPEWIRSKETDDRAMALTQFTKVRAILQAIYDLIYFF